MNAEQEARKRSMTEAARKRRAQGANTMATSTGESQEGRYKEPASSADSLVNNSGDRTNVVGLAKRLGERSGRALDSWGL